MEMNTTISDKTNIQREYVPHYNLPGYSTGEIHSWIS